VQRVNGAQQLAYEALSSEEAATSAGAADIGSQSSAAPSDRLLIVTASMDVRVDDLEQSLDALRSSVAKSGGEVAELSVSSSESPIVPVPLDAAPGHSESGGPSSAIVTIRVPAERLESLRADVAGLGTVISESASASDVTEQAIDLEARLRNLRAEEARLRTFLARTTKVSELLEVERELARVRGEIESMDAQLTYLERQAARATLTVSLSEPGPVVRPVTGGWGLREAITRGIQATASMVSTMITVAIPLAFVALVVLAIGYPVRTLLRRRARSAISAEGEQQEDGEA
jgi:cell division septum initiation protein DivIVA